MSFVIAVQIVGLYHTYIHTYTHTTIALFVLRMMCTCSATLSFCVDDPLPTILYKDEIFRVLFILCAPSIARESTLQTEVVYGTRVNADKSYG